MKKVKCVETNEVFNSIREASIDKNINEASISNSMNKKQKAKTAGGYHWVLVKENE
jgi:hypothetical protein